MSDQEQAAAHIKVADAVQAWIKEYHRYLLDGDPNIMHPKAKAALICMISDLLTAQQDENAILAPRRRLGKNGKISAVGE